MCYNGLAAQFNIFENTGVLYHFSTSVFLYLVWRKICDSNAEYIMGGASVL